MDETVTLYELEPDLVDYYVEGRTDKVLLEYLLDGLEVKIVEIGEIDLPAEMLAELGLRTGARSRVVALAATLDRQLSGGQRYAVRCIVDADFDRILDTAPPASRILRFTDFSCLESYWFDDYHVAKYRRLGLHDLESISSRDILSDLAPVLRRCFVLRAAARHIGADLTWLSATTCCTVASGEVVFDEDEFITRWLNKNSAHSLKSDLLTSIRKIEASLPEDGRHTLHGHDFIYFLSWYIRPHVRDRELAHFEVVARMLACCADRAAMLSYPMLAELVELATAA